MTQTTTQRAKVRKARERLERATDTRDYAYFEMRTYDTSSVYRAYEIAVEEWDRALAAYTRAIRAEKGPKR